MTFPTVEDELRLQEKARHQVLASLGRIAEANPSKLVNTAAKKGTIPAYVVKRAVWSLLAEGQLVFTSDNKVRLATVR
ncbi:MAG: hypothetical protein NTZ48_07680 [Candidatus Omnitrophica bacterium]|nr:hypothetical protein [Candidatus Omnitrophota bacterium]